MAKKKVGTSGDSNIRQCASIRSKKIPDQQCTFSATSGEFCMRHSKNQIRFQKSGIPEQEKEQEQEQEKRQEKAATILAVWWRHWVGPHRFKVQGPAANYPAVAENETDIFSLDPIDTISQLYRWSYADSNKHIWLFDVRSLSMSRGENKDTLLNPYTREPIQNAAAIHFIKRCTYLRDKKYCLVHSADQELTPEQLWHQKVLDVTMKYDILGYHTCLSWFEELSGPQLNLFYVELWELWFYRLQLSNIVKNQVVPHWNRTESLLFKWQPYEVQTRLDKKWWQKHILELLNRLVSSAELKEHKTLGALYGMTAFAIVSPRVRLHYPWLVEMPEDF